MKRLTRLAVFTLVAFPTGVGAAVATPPAGVVGETLLRNTLEDPNDKMKLILSLMRTGAVGPSDVLVQRVTVAASGHTGWHSHSGPTLINVTSGTLTLYAANSPSCIGHDYPAGTSFVEADGEVGIVRNETDAPAEFHVVFIIPPGASPRVDAPQPDVCPF